MRNDFDRLIERFKSLAKIMLDNNTQSTVIYTNLEAAAAAVCQRWCQQNSYTTPFFQNDGVMPVKIHDVIHLDHTQARRVQIQHYSITLSIALLPDGCIAPHNHPEV